MSSRTVRLGAVDSNLRRIATILGWISLFAVLALTSPGVVLKANAEPAEAGPSCQADRSAERDAVALAQTVERLRAEAALVPADPASDVVVLNNRGYFYGPEVASEASGSPAPRR